MIALRHRDFRLLLLGQGIAGVGLFMQVVGQSLLVLRLSDGSPVALGAVSLAQALAFFGFSLVGGGLVDRFALRRVLFVTQSLLFALAAALTLLTVTGRASVPAVVALAFIAGVVSSFDGPARSALLPRLVSRDELPRATALNSLVMTAAATVGPAAAGIAAETMGLGLNFAVNAGGYLVQLLCVGLMRVPDGRSPEASGAGGVGQRGPRLEFLGEGLRVVARHRTLPWIVAGYAGLLLLGPSPSLMLPLFASQVLGDDGTQLGLLFLMVGLGTVLASAFQALFGGGNRPYFFAMALAVWAAALVAFGLSDSGLVAAIALLIHGAARNLVGTSAVTMMQLEAPEAVRGRVMSLNTFLSNGLRPLGDFGISAGMAATSVPFMAVGCGLVVLVFAAQLPFRLDARRRSRPAGTGSRDCLAC